MYYTYLSYNTNLYSGRGQKMNARMGVARLEQLRAYDPRDLRRIPRYIVDILVYVVVFFDGVHGSVSSRCLCRSGAWVVEDTHFARKATVNPRFVGS